MFFLLLFLSPFVCSTLGSSVWLQWGHGSLDDSSYQLEARSAGHNHDIYEDHSGSDSWTFCTVCEMGRRHCSVEKNEASDYLSSFWLTSSARITTIGTGVERLPDHPYTFRHKREKSTHYLSTFRLMLPGSMATIGTRLSGCLITCTYSGMNNRDKVVTSPSSAVPYQTAWPQWDKAEWLPDYLYTIRHEWERQSAVITCPSSNSPDQTEWSQQGQGWMVTWIPVHIQTSTTETKLSNYRQSWVIAGLSSDSTYLAGWPQ